MTSINTASHSKATTTTVINIGEVLRRAGGVTQDQIDDGVEYAFERGTMLGAALIAVGACTPVELAIALDRQRRIAGDGADRIRALDELMQDTFKAARIATACALVAAQ